MVLTIPRLLTPSQVTEFQKVLGTAEWIDGKATAGYLSSRTKNNEQVPEGHPAARRLGNLILDELDKNQLFIAAALPLRVLPPLFNRYTGGQSYGGRQATMLVADEPGQVAGLLLFSYPLYPPGKPERLRTEHFPRLRVPCLFVQGTADPFGSPDELRAAIAAIPARTELIPVERAGHDLKSGRFDFAPVVATVLRLGTEVTAGRG